MYHSILIKPFSATCNLRCKYCFYADVSQSRQVKSYGKMKIQTAQKLIENIFASLSPIDTLNIAFQGGEPTLAGLKFFKEFVAFVQQQPNRPKITYALQTNGILLDDDWCAFLKENNFLVGLSIDGPAKFHDLYRLDPKGQATFKRLLAAKKRLEQYQVDFNILCVLTSQLAHHPQQIFNFLLNQNIKYIQFIPCLDELQANSPSQYALNPQLFNRFYQTMFKLWLQDLKKGHYISIKLFDDIISLVIRKQVNACGLTGYCSFQTVIEADGSVFPCDFYALDDYYVGNITTSPYPELRKQAIIKKFLTSRKALSTFCSQCPFKKLCNGGCKRMEQAMYVDKTNQFCGYQQLLHTILPKVNEVMLSLPQAYF